MTNWRAIHLRVVPLMRLLADLQGQLSGIMRVQCPIPRLRQNQNRLPVSASVLNTHREALLLRRYKNNPLLPGFDECVSHCTPDADSRYTRHAKVSDLIYPDRPEYQRLWNLS